MPRWSKSPGPVPPVRGFEVHVCIVEKTAPTTDIVLRHHGRQYDLSVKMQEKNNWAPADADALRNVRKPRWGYGFFSAHVLVAASHVPPAFVQSASVFAAAAPAKAGPVKASARVIANIETRIFMAFSPLRWTKPQYLNALFETYVPRNTRSYRRLNRCRQPGLATLSRVFTGCRNQHTLRETRPGHLGRVSY
jgi:hypothetical protein